MTPVEFDGCNTQMPGTTYVPAMCKVDPETGEPITIVAWQPNTDDLKAIAAGRSIFMKIGTFMVPPIGLFTFNENGELNV